MKIIPLDASHLTCKQDAHEYISAALHFPPHYGHNLDALADCLAELGRDTAILVTNAAQSSEYAKQVIEVLCEVLKNGRRVCIIS